MQSLECLECRSVQEVKIKHKQTVEQVVRQEIQTNKTVKFIQQPSGKFVPTKT